MTKLPNNSFPVWRVLIRGGIKGPLFLFNLILYKIVKL